jgi:hypothetical protein
MWKATWTALVIVGAGCGHAPPAPQLSNTVPLVASAGPLVPGVYTCSINEGGYDYDPFRCEVRDRDQTQYLAKVAGSVQLGGVVRPAAGGGFRFVGLRFCPWGDCTERVESVFAPIAGGYRGEIVSEQSGPSTVTVKFARAFGAREAADTHVTDALAAAHIGTDFGGYGYGGLGYGAGFGFGPDGYGGAGYGGAGYGGGAYGGAPLEVPDP